MHAAEGLRTYQMGRGWRRSGTRHTFFLPKADKKHCRSSELFRFAQGLPSETEEKLEPILAIVGDVNNTKSRQGISLQEQQYFPL